MKNAIRYVLIALLFAVLMGGDYFAYEKLSENYNPDSNSQNENSETQKDEINEENKPIVTAPDFTVWDKDGNEVKLSDFFGKPIVLNFWATWCGPCQNEMPAFDAMAAEYGEEVEFLMINLTDGVQDTVEGAMDFVTDYGYTFPVYFDKELDATYTYGVYSIPRTVFINADGSISYKYAGMIAEKLLKEKIEEILK